MRKLRPHLNATWAMITAVIALAGSAVGLVFDLKPEWRPDPRDRIQGEIEILAVEPKISLARWAQLANPEKPSEELKEVSGSSDVEQARRDRGVAVYVRITLSGYKDRKVQLRARVYNRHTQTPIDYNEADVAILDKHPEGRQKKINAPTRSSVRILFLPPFDELDIQKTFVRVELRSGSDLLAVRDSPTLLRGRIAAGQRAA